MPHPDDEYLSRFAEYLAALRAMLPLDENTRLCAELAETDFRAAVLAIAISRGSHKVRCERFEKVSQTLIEALEGLCDTEGDYE